MISAPIRTGTSGATSKGTTLAGTDLIKINQTCYLEAFRTRYTALRAKFVRLENGANKRKSLVH